MRRGALLLDPSKKNCRSFDFAREDNSKSSGWKVQVEAVVLVLDGGEGAEG
jgi:hypothetical protein